MTNGSRIALLLHIIVVLNVAILITASNTPAEPSKPVLISQVPLREGLTIVSAYSDPPRGDYEPVITINKVDTKAIIVTLSSDEPTDCAGQRGRLDSDRSLSSRSVLRVDLEGAHAFQQEFPQCALEPALYPGTTSFGVSASVLRELRKYGQTKLNIVGGQKDTPGVLTRSAKQTIPFKVILNDRPVEVATIHARWHSSKSNIDFWILDDPDNPLVLRWSHKGKTFHEVIKLSFPTSERMARVQRDLSEQGRTVVYGIYFDFASDRIKEESEPELKEIADIMTKNPTWQLYVEGHTDNLGGPEANLQLSQRRAAAVSKALSERYKIAPTRLKSAGFGETKPKASNETLEGRALNRRVELVRIGG